AKTRPSFIEEFGPFGRLLRDRIHYPFGSFLGVSATMSYRFKTDNLPLKTKLKKASESLIGASAIEDLNRCKGAHGDERGLPI
ncbi:MAG: hypothetical protein SV775_13685, partial [Thermodesulfobacteriota bacterium]|nr:hypothetical protein [Thermodesulfobacteriota bacterium]